MTELTSSSGSNGDNVSRRDVLKLGSAGILGMSAGEQTSLRGESPRGGDGSIDGCIFILLTGGPGHLDTFDPKPHAPAGIRGPFGAIATATPGIQLSETLPRLAQRADKFALLRSLHHSFAPIHEVSLQLLQTGRAAVGGVTYPAFGAAISSLLGQRNHVPPYCVLPQRLGYTGVRAPQGQTAGILGGEHEPAVADDRRLPVAPPATSPYGATPLAKNCYHARQLIERGARFVTVNMYTDLDEQPTWDCHGVGASLSDYRQTVCPDFDTTLAALLDDLETTGLLRRTLVVAAGEFGRTPRINPRGGRDHWPGVWSALLAGGPVAGGQVIGASDARGVAPIDRPTTPDALLATISAAFGINHATTVEAADDTEFSLSPATPIEAFFC